MSPESEPITPQLFEGTLKVAEVLEHHQVNYAIIGGLAAGYRTHPRSTRDIDVLLNVPQIILPKVLEDLETCGFEFALLPTIREWLDHHMTVLSYHGIQVDWLKAIIPAYQHILDRATEEMWLGRRVRMASAEGLILMKLIAARTQDWLDIENLVAAQQSRLDLDWIREEWRAIASEYDPRMTRLLGLVERAREIR